MKKITSEVLSDNRGHDWLYMCVCLKWNGLIVSTAV